jgi:hypothetical protein
VKPSRTNPAHSRTAGLRYLAAGLLVAMLSQPALASAADRSDRGDITLPVVRSPSLDQRELPEVSPGGTVVLRGTRAANPNAGNPNAGQPYPGGSEADAAAAANGPAAPLNATPGWDRQFDRGGLDTSAAPPMIGTIGVGR